MINKFGKFYDKNLNGSDVMTRDLLQIHAI